MILFALAAAAWHWLLQYWIDEFLQWNPKDFDNMTIISIPSENIWVPDIMISELCPLPSQHPIVDNMTYSLPLWLPAEHINMSTWRTANDAKKDLRMFYNKGEWELVKVYSSYRLEADEGEEFAVLTFNIIFKRHPLYYLVNLIIPSIFLMALDIIGFYLPIESGERITFKITLLLGYSVFLIIVTDTLPASAHTTPIIGMNDPRVDIQYHRYNLGHRGPSDCYFLVCMALLVISLTESIFIVRIDKNWRIKQKRNLSDEPQDMEDTSSDKVNRFTGIGEPSAQTPAVINERSEIMESIFNEIVTIRQNIKDHNDHGTSNEWLLIGYVLDKFLFWVYLITVMTYSVTLVICWSNHIVV
ncbi:unnamed protein product [Ranitomeya imitator]|uniref:5-hydroxytryptamine receptor 3A n=1 Tax=Ranitomeya imitator TaxID=111125 RepID=A0ABN9LF19_9NEOB|nr:unnamed protein product [Ranitomeya imitator]